MAKKFSDFFVRLCLSLSIIAICSIVLFPQKAVAEKLISLDKINKLQEKVANSYSSKFCNAIGMGISKEGSTRLTITENKESKFNPALWFELATSGENNLDKIDQGRVLELTSEKIIRDCGAAIGLSGKEGIDAFKDYFTSIKNEIDNS